MAKYLIILLLCTGSVHAKQIYHIQLGDQIHIALPGETTLNKDFTVSIDGTINLPEIGIITIIGYSETELQKKLHQSLSPVFRDMSGFSVFVAKKRLLIYVMGYVKKPGKVFLSASANVQMALQAAGGLRSGAQLDKLQLRSSNNTNIFNYKKYLDSGDNNILPRLSSLDTLFVPASPMIGNIEVDFDPTKMAAGGDASDKFAIKVFGEVHQQGTFSFNPGTSLIEFLMKAGGVTRYAGVEQIRVITNGEPVLFNLKHYLDSGDATLLPLIAPGSTIFIPRQEEQIKTGSSVVYVMGEVFKPGAYEGKKDITFMDILANAGGPTRFAESRQIKIIKADGQVESFDLTAYTHGTTDRSLPAIVAGDAIFVPEKTDINEK